MAFPLSKEKYTNRLLAGDVEANGLLEDVSKLWCIVSEDVGSGEVFLFHDFPEYNNVEIFDPADGKTYTVPERTGSLVDGVRFWYLAAHNGSKLIVHNCLSYDKPLLERFYPKFETPVEAWVDTLIQSKMQWFDRPTPKGCKGQHGLASYGARFGIIKPEVTDWKEMDAFKLHRCIQDNQIQAKTYSYLEKERNKVYEKLGISLLGGYEVEQDYRISATEQEIAGALIDVPHVDACIEDLDNKIEELRKEIEPNLPPTVKPKTPKIGISELTKQLGLREQKDKVGTDGKILKPYHKPTTKYTKTKKGFVYKGFDISCGDSPEFSKKKELTDWIKTNHPDFPPSFWKIKREERDQTLLSAATCTWFGVDEDADFIAGPFTKVEFLESKLTQSEVVKKYLIGLGWKFADEWNIKKDSEGNFVKAEEDMEVRYPLKASPENQMVRKIKKGDLVVTSPKLTDSDYESLPEGMGQSIANYNTYNHRRRFFENPKDPENKGLKSYIREGTNRVPCGVNNFNTSTGRSSHSVWVNVAGDGSLYGEESRKTIIAPENRVVVGADMKSAQLSIAGYYACNEEYYNACASGEEFDENGIYIGRSAHCINARAFTLVSEQEYRNAVSSQDKELIHSISLRRKASKGGSFATIFGASGRKVATTLGIPEKLGTQKKKAFLQNIGLDSVIEILNRMTTKNARAGGGYIELPFGYYVWSNKPHKFFNYLDQGTEAACQKWAVNYFTKESKRLGLDCVKILDMHDEFLVESAQDVADVVGKLMCKAYEEASYAVWEWHKKHSKWFVGEALPSFCFNLDGGYKVGKNYYEVH